MNIINFIRIFIPIILLFSVSLAGQEKSAAASDSVMMVFSQSARGLEKSIAASNTRSVIRYLQKMQQVLPDFYRLKPEKNFGEMDAFKFYQEEIATLTRDMAIIAEVNNALVLPEKMVELKRNCVSCHVRFRSSNKELGHFPAQNNIISGRVNIRKLDGAYRPDRSNLVVFLDKPEDGKVYKLPKIVPRVSQRGRTFSPRVLPILKGTTVMFPNDDTIFHNVFSLSKAKPFDLGIYKAGKSKSVTFQHSGLVKVFCNIHPKMTANILVLNNPCFTMTDQHGFFVISGIPDGNYILRVWHEFGQEYRRDIQLSGGENREFSIRIQENKKFIQHENKFGKPYKKKY